MSEVGHDQPCPCGSGRTHGSCCFDDERDAPTLVAIPGDAGDAGEAGKAREAEDDARIWQADLVPLGPSFQQDPSTRPAVLLVRAGRPFVFEQILDRPPADPDELARVLARAVTSAIESSGRSPTTVDVHYAEVAEALAPLLRDRDVAVKRAPMGELREIVRVMVFERTGRLDPLVSRPDMWAGWGLPEATVADLFGAAAELWRAAPWRRIQNHRVLTVEIPDGRTWTATLHGHAGDAAGLGLYSHPEDFRSGFSYPTPDEALMNPLGRVVQVEYLGLRELPRPMQREVASAGWEVAASEAYPILHAINTPAGGLTRRDAADLVAAVRALSALPTSEAERIARREPSRWRHPPTGALVAYEGTDPAPRSSMGIWRLSETLQPGGPRGPRADPGAPVRARIARLADVRRSADLAGILRRTSDATGEAAADLEAELAARFTPRLERTAVDDGVPERFVARLRAKGYEAAEVDRHHLDVRAFLEVLEEWRRIPLAAVHEYDLRVFLFDLYPREYRNVLHPHEDINLSLDAFFIWLTEEEGIECRGAEEAIGDWVAYDMRLASAPPGMARDDAVRAWRATLRDDLDARVLLHDARLGRTRRWNREADVERAFRSIESLLEDELQRRWLLWRDEVIRSGETDPEEVRALLVERQRAWEMTPHEALDGLTPIEAVEAERRKGGADG